MTRPYAQIFLILILGICLGVGSRRGLFEGADLRIFDNFFLLRHQLAWEPPIDPRIAIIELDNDLFSTIGQPVSRWSDDYAGLTETLFEHGAEVVAFDILFSPQLAKLPPEDQDKIYSEIEQFAGVVATRPLVLIDTYRQVQGDTLTSIDVLHSVAESEGNVGYNNLLTDSDGVVRTLGLFFYNQEPRSSRNFVGRIAELATGKSILRLDDRVEGMTTEETTRLRINYPGPPSSLFYRIKASRILLGEKPKVEGKICLIGPTYDSSNDLHNTPLNLALGTWGIEIHASALNTILTEQYLTRSPPWTHFALTLLGVFIGWGLALRAPPQLLLFGGGILVAIYGFVIFLVFAKFRLLCPLVGPLLAATFTGGITSVARYRALESSRRYVQSVLGRFVSPQVMEELLASPDNLQLGGRRRTITVLFTDINNFTPLCEKSTPEEVIIMLNEFFNEMLDIIFRYDGTVKQFVGDEIMVMYGAPNTIEDHARRAVLTARDMITRLAELKEQNPGKLGFYEVKVGIHTGEVVVGNVGNDKRSEYAAVGDPVNTTARIEGLTKALGEAILVSEVTVKELGESLPGITFVSKGPQNFKGKSDQMEVYGIRWS